MTGQDRTTVASRGQTVFGRPFVKRFTVCYRTVVCLSVLSSLSHPVLSVTWVYCGQTVGPIKMKLGVQVYVGPGHIVLDGDPAPPPQTGDFRPTCCGQMAGWIKIPLGMEEGLGPGDFVLDGDPAPLSQKRRRSPSPQFSAHVHCGQTAGCVKMALGTEVGLGPGYIRLDWDPAPLSKKGAESPPNFRPIPIVAKRLDASKSVAPEPLGTGGHVPSHFWN